MAQPTLPPAKPPVGRWLTFTARDPGYHTAYPRISDPISNADFLMLKQLEKKFPFLSGHRPLSDIEKHSREAIKDAAKMRARAYDYEHRDSWYHRPRRLEPTWMDTAGPVAAATFSAGMIALGVWAARRDPWEKPPTEHMPFEFNPTILLWDAFEGPEHFEIISKHPSIQVKILGSGGLNYTQCLRIRWPSVKRSAWRGITLRWYHNLPLRDIISYGFIHHGGHIASPQYIEASGNYAYHNSIVRTGFYINASDMIWPIYLRSYPRNVKFSIPLQNVVIPGYYATCAWTSFLLKQTYMAATINNAPIPVAGCPIRMYPIKQLVLPFIEIELWHGWQESADYYLDNVTVITTGEVLPDLNQELARRTQTWPMEDLQLDPAFHPATIPA